MYEHVNIIGKQLNLLKILCYLFWVISQRLNFICRSFGTLCSIFIGRVNKKSSPSSHDLWRWNRQSVLNVGILNSDFGESPKRKNTTFKTQRKFI